MTKTIEEEVEYGIDQFDPDRTIEIPLRDALYAYKAIGEFIRFFHQPMHYPDLRSVEEFLGNSEAGGLHVLREVYYERFRDVWPEDVDQAFANGTLDYEPLLDEEGEG